MKWNRLRSGLKNCNALQVGVKRITQITKPQGVILHPIWQLNQI